MWQKLKNIVMKPDKLETLAIQPKHHDGHEALPTHLEDYLGYYLNLDRPGYAVLVTGEWGSGKTYQVKGVIPQSDRYYVSLYGVQTVEQLHAEVFAVASPKLAAASSVVDNASSTTASVGGLFALAGATPSVFNAIFKRDIKPDRTLIFDDLERSDLGLKDVLGAINSYVEQQGFRVIVIAHDDKMTAKFRKMKEKIFGQTIKVQPQIDQAFETFLGKIKLEQAKRLVLRYRNPILSTFQSSEVRSLRILRHVIEDLERLAATLLDEHIDNEEAIAELVPLFVAFDIETRFGRVDQKAMQNRLGVSMAYLMSAHGKDGDPPEKPLLLLANERYPSIDMESQLLSDEVLCLMFFEGSYPVQIIRQVSIAE